MYYFVSDTHLGLSSERDPRQRERLFVSWLEEVSLDAEAIFLVGDIFDFWFEYRRVVPKGFVRLLGKLAELSDRGIKLHFFTGNHDMWTAGYLRDEIGMEVHYAPEVFSLSGKRVFVAHGDNIYPRGVKAPMLRTMNAFFRSKCARRIVSRVVHPDLFMKWGQLWSSSSRKSKQIKTPFRGEEEWLVRYAREYLNGGENRVDYFVFGHLHCASRYPLGGGVTAFFMGEWIEEPTYVTLDKDGVMQGLRFKKDK
jgi:UDP-2,3-diacylglucosamine hydrolase